MILKISLITLVSLSTIAVIVYVYLVYLFNMVPKAKAAGIRIAWVGDSITQGMGVMFNHMTRNSSPAMLQDMLGIKYQVLNYGHTGRTLLKSGDFPYLKSPFYAASINSEPSILLIMLGTNDSKPHNWNAAEYERQLEELVKTYKNLASSPSIYLLTPPAAFVRKGKTEIRFKINNEIIENEIVPIVKRVADQTNTPVIDIFSETQGHPEYFPDGVHSNIAGNKVIAEMAFAALKEKSIKN